MSYQIITDSCSDLTEVQLQQWDVTCVNLTLRYHEGEIVTMFIPGIGALWVGIHWASRGRELHFVKALDIRLTDGRVYTLQSENYTRLELMGIRQTQEGIQLTDEHGDNYVDTPLIPFSSFQH